MQQPPLPGYERVQIDLNPPTPPLTVEPAKPWWQSTGVIGSAATVIVAGLSAAGVPIPFDAVVLALTGALSLYGRVMATRPIAGSITGSTK